MFDRQDAPQKWVPPVLLGILEPHCPLVLLIHTKHKNQQKQKDEILDLPHVLISLKENSSTG